MTGNEATATDYALEGDGGVNKQGTGSANQSGASGVLSLEGAKRAATGAASFVDANIQDTGHSFRALAFVGAVAIVVTSVLDFFRGVLEIDLTHIMISIVVCFFSIIICLLEGRSHLPSQLVPFQSKLYEQANFLRLITGRGFFYFFTGLLQFSHWSFLNMVSGGFMMFVGLLYVVVGRATGKKLASVRAAIKDETALQASFADNDSDNDGYLTQNDFEMMIMGMDLNLSPNELIAAFTAIDENDDGKISFDEFKTWWSGSNSTGTMNII